MLDNLHFAWPWIAVLLPLPWLIVYGAGRFGEPKQWQPSAVFFPHFAHHSKEVGAAPSTAKPFSKVLIILAWASLIAAMARPQWIGETQTVPHTGREVMLALDLSESMNTTDMPWQGRTVDRLTLVKSLTRDFISSRQGDRLGMIVFADTAYLYAPMTYDLQTLGVFLMQTQTGMIGDATAITDAIGLAAKQFNQQVKKEASQETNRVLVLMTDGQNTSGNLTPGQALDIAEFHNITIYAIAVGAEQQTDFEFLRSLTRTTQGELFYANDGRTLSEIFQRISELEPTESDFYSFTPVAEIYYLAASLAVLFFLIAQALQGKLWHAECVTGRQLWKR